MTFIIKIRAPDLSWKQDMEEQQRNKLNVPKKCMEDNEDQKRQKVKSLMRETLRRLEKLLEGKGVAEIVVFEVFRDLSHQLERIWEYEAEIEERGEEECEERVKEEA